MRLTRDHDDELLLAPREAPGEVEQQRHARAVETAVAFRELGRSAPAYGSSPLTKSRWTMSHLDRADSVRATLWSFLSSALAPVGDRRWRS